MKPGDLCVFGPDSPRSLTKEPHPQDHTKWIAHKWAYPDPEISCIVPEGQTVLLLGQLGDDDDVTSVSLVLAGSKFGWTYTDRLGVA
jgi:hypothetical protein